MKLAADTDEPSSLFEGLDWLNMPKLKEDSSAPVRFALKPLSSNVPAEAAGGAGRRTTAAAATKAHIPPAAPSLQLPQQLDQHHAQQQPKPAARTFNRSRTGQQRPAPALSTVPAASFLPGNRPSLSISACSPALNPLKSVLHSFDFPTSDSDEDATGRRGPASATAQQQLQPTAMLAALQPSERKALAPTHRRSRSRPKQRASLMQQQQDEEEQQQEEECSMHELVFDLPGTKQTTQQAQPRLVAGPAAAAAGSKPSTAAAGSKPASKLAAAAGGSNPASKLVAAGLSWLLPLDAQEGKQSTFAVGQAAATAGASRSRAPKSSSPSTAALTELAAHPMHSTDRQNSKASTQQQTAAGVNSSLPPLGGTHSRSSIGNKAAPKDPPAALLPPLPVAAGSTQGSQQHASGAKLQAGRLPTAVAAAGAPSARTKLLQQQQQKQQQKQQQQDFAIFSADGEMELVMESPASLAASLSTSQQQQQQGWRMLAAPSLDTNQQQKQQQQQKGRRSLLAAASVLQAQLANNQQQQESAGGSQGTGSEGAHAAAGNSSSYSSSGSDSRDGSGSESEAGATVSSGSVWSGDSANAAGGSSSRSEECGSDSDAGYVVGEGRKRRGSGAAGAGLSRAKARKVQQQQQGQVPGLLLPQLPQLQPSRGSKASKFVRFAEGDVAAGAKKQGLVLLGLGEGADTGKGSSSRASRGSGKAAGSARVLECSCTVLPGEVPLLLPSAHALLRSGILLVELPAGFDAEGDAGAIGRVVCTSAGPSADGYAVARVSSRPPDKPRQARKGKAAVSKAGAAAAGADGSDSGAAVSSESLDEEEDGESDSQSNQEGSAVALGSDEALPSGIPSLDLKGMFYDIQELALAGTAAVVRINAPGKGSAGKPASAHMEHLLSSFLRATPSAAATAAADDWDTADGYDWEADEAGAAWDPMDCDAAAMGMGAEGEGQQGGAQHQAGAGGKGKGKGAGKKGRGPAGAGRKGKGGTGAGTGRKAGGAKKKGAGRKPRVQKQGKKAVGVGAAAGRGATGGAKAAAGARGKAVGAEGARKPGAGNKQAKKDPWETDSGVPDSE